MWDSSTKSLVWVFLWDDRRLHGVSSVSVPIRSMQPASNSYLHWLVPVSDSEWDTSKLWLAVSAPDFFLGSLTQVKYDSPMIPFYQLENIFIRICGDGIISCGHSMDDVHEISYNSKMARISMNWIFLTNKIIITIRCQWYILMALRIKFHNDPVSIKDLNGFEINKI